MATSPILHMFRPGRQYNVFCAYIATAAVLDGKLPRRAGNLVCEWARQHRDELQRNWDLARAHQPLEPIPPLE